jgi:hypothetical protein
MVKLALEEGIALVHENKLVVPIRGTQDLPLPIIDNQPLMW